MTRGLGERQRKDRLLTTSKITNYLFVKPSRYQELQKVSKIHRQRLRDGLDELVMQRIVIKHKFSIRNDPDIEHNSTYYILDLSKAEYKESLKYYYYNSKGAKLNIKDERPIHGGIDGQLLDLINYAATKERSQMSTKQYLLLIFKISRSPQLHSLKKQLESSIQCESSERGILFALQTIVSLLYVGYLPLDVLVKLSDEKMEEVGIYHYFTLWEIMERTGLFSKY